MTDEVKVPRKRAPRKTPAVTVTEPPEAPEEEQLYIRNRGGVRIRIRSPRKRGEEYDYSLAPRGERGDAEPIDADDLAYLQNNAENEGLYEIITHTQAMSYMTKQTRNQQRYHPALAALTDEFGNPIKGIAHHRQQIAVATSNVTVPEGDLNQLNVLPPGRPE